MRICIAADALGYWRMETVQVVDWVIDPLVAVMVRVSVCAAGGVVGLPDFPPQPVAARSRATHANARSRMGQPRSVRRRRLKSNVDRRIPAGRTARKLLSWCNESGLANGPRLACEVVVRVTVAVEAVLPLGVTEAGAMVQVV